jgi:putative ABC transport system ATP-binding protein
MTTALIQLAELGFAWPGQPELLDIPSFTLEPGHSLFLKGPSGSGKTTLLGLLGGVQKPQRGSIKLLGQDLSQLSAGARDRFRVDHTGYIFQQFNLLPFLSVRENVELPCHFSRLRASRASARHGSVSAACERLLGHLGLDQPAFLKRRAGDLSIGQQQRVAAARALIGQPELVISCCLPNAAPPAPACCLSATIKAWPACLIAAWRWLNSTAPAARRRFNYVSAASGPSQFG